jgi:hypothetical protein
MVPAQYGGPVIPQADGITPVSTLWGALMSTLYKRLPASAVLALMLLAGIAPGVHAELKKQNIVQLIESSQSIVGGTVSHVTDGIDANGVPYTEVTIKVGVSPKGSISKGEYTFRQFGLIKPRTMPNGHRMLSVTPEEFPQWRENEYVVAFLYHPAAKTGLQTTVGLAQGKFIEINGKLANRFDNRGLFEGVKAAPGTLSTRQQALLKSSGPVDATELMGLINRVVKGNMIQKGEIK